MTCLTKTKHHISLQQKNCNYVVWEFYNAMVFLKWVSTSNVQFISCQVSVFICSNEHCFDICREADIYRGTDTERKTQDRPSKTHKTQSWDAKWKH